MADADQAFLEDLRGYCEKLAVGDYATIDGLFALTGNTDAPPIVQALAEAFGSMAVQIEAREYRLTEMLADLQDAHRRLEAVHQAVASENVALRGDVARLKIEIDEARKDTEVSEIVESDYFQMLQDRARGMRERHRP